MANNVSVGGYVISDFDDYNILIHESGYSYNLIIQEKDDVVFVQSNTISIIEVK